VIVHLQIHPQLDVRTLECYGFVEPDGDDLHTLFLEDAGAVRYSPRDLGQRVLAGRWLAALHSAVAAAPIGDSLPALLPDRGPSHYLMLLDQSRSVVSGWSSPTKDSAAVLASVLLSQLDELEARWALIEECCALAPTTLVHGDLKPEHMHLTQSPGGTTTLLAIDWEAVRFGSPAVDLAAGVDLAAYVQGGDAFWPSVQLPAAKAVSTAGTILRALAAIFWQLVAANEWWEVDANEWWEEDEMDAWEYELDECRAYSATIATTLTKLDAPS
jgi:hypothetical protein